VADVAKDAMTNDCDCVMVPLVRRPADAGGAAATLAASALSGASATLGSTPLDVNCVGVFSEAMDMDSAEPGVRALSETAFEEQLRYSSHLGLPAVLLKARSATGPNTWRQTQRQLLGQTALDVWVHVPLSGEAGEDTWLRWDRFRCACEHHKSLGVVLELTKDLPGPESWQRWYGEPVRAISMSTDIFLTNKAGQPVLSKPHQRLVVSLLTFRPRLIIHGALPKLGTNELNRHLRYLQFLWNSQPPPSDQERWERPYYDYLQAPLQPLQDNLENATYATFERDPVKYVAYEQAVYEALCDQPAERSTVVLMVVGAGRGPLVIASLKAAERAKRPIRVFAVEKNLNAVVTLQQLSESRGWGDAVSIISCDMRTWEAPEQADILVSELLGSFGDNELSPECLDGAQRFLKRDGISIPKSYTSHVAPSMSSKLFNEVMAYGDTKHFETSYVVKLHNVWQMTESKPCFVFDHPNWDAEIDNSRCKELSFEIAQAGRLHGISGFFDTALYADVMISINPQTVSDGMFSWFPLWFPLREPMLVRPGSVITLSIWRSVDKSTGKVWYEWTVRVADADGQQADVSATHNPAGRGSFIGL